MVFLYHVHNLHIGARLLLRMGRYSTTAARYMLVSALSLLLLSVLFDRPTIISITNDHAGGGHTCTKTDYSATRKFSVNNIKTDDVLAVAPPPAAK